MAAEKNQPVHQYRLGKIVGTVWFNEDDNGRGTRTVSSCGNEVRGLFEYL